MDIYTQHILSQDLLYNNVLVLNMDDVFIQSMNKQMAYTFSQKEQIAAYNFHDKLLYVSYLRTGKAMCSLTANDEYGNEETVEFELRTAKNLAPEITKPLPDLVMHPGQIDTIDLSGYVSYYNHDLLNTSLRFYPSGIVKNDFSDARYIIVQAISPGSVLVGAEIRGTDDKQFCTGQFHITVLATGPYDKNLYSTVPVNFEQEYDTVDLNNYFGDYQNETLTFSLARPVDKMKIEGNELIVAKGATSLFPIEITATNSSGLSCTNSIIITNETATGISNIPDQDLSGKMYSVIDLHDYYKLNTDHSNIDFKIFNGLISSARTIAECVLNPDSAANAMQLFLYPVALGEETVTINAYSRDCSCYLADQTFKVRIDKMPQPSPLEYISFDTVYYIDQEVGSWSQSISMRDYLPQTDRHVQWSSCYGAGTRYNSMYYYANDSIGVVTHEVLLYDNLGNFAKVPFTVKDMRSPKWVAKDSYTDIETKAGEVEYRFNIRDYLYDPQGTYNISVLNMRGGSFSIDGMDATMRYESTGSCSFTLKASNPSGSVFRNFIFTPEHRSSLVIKQIPDMYLPEGFGAVRIDLNDYFAPLDSVPLSFFYYQYPKYDKIALADHYFTIYEDSLPVESLSVFGADQTSAESIYFKAIVSKASLQKPLLYSDEYITMEVGDFLDVKKFNLSENFSLDYSARTCLYQYWQSPILYAFAEGSTIINLNDGVKVLTLHIEIQKAKADHISFMLNEIYLQVGDIVELPLSVAPVILPDCEMQFAISDPNIMKLNGRKLQSLAVGQSTVTVTSGIETAQLLVHVVDKAADAEKISIVNVSNDGDSRYGFPELVVQPVGARYRTPDIEVSSNIATFQNGTIIYSNIGDAAISITSSGVTTRNAVSTANLAPVIDSIPLHTGALAGYFAPVYLGLYISDDFTPASVIQVSTSSGKKLIAEINGLILNVHTDDLMWSGTDTITITAMDSQGASSTRSIAFSVTVPFIELSSHNISNIFDPLSVYPNPASTYLTVRLPEGTVSNVLIYASDGLLVYSGQAHAETSIPIDGIKPGLYNISINTNGKFQTQTIVIE